MNRRVGQEGSGFVPLGEALAHADRCRSEGRLQEAEAVCRQILLAQPSLPEAEHLLGVIALQSGKLAEAVEHARRAVRLAPQVALFHANLGEMLRLSGHPRLAVEEARRALAIDPRMPAALSNLGVALYELKDYAEAARAQRRAIAANPEYSEAHSNLGNALHALRQFEEAIAAYSRAVELNPSYADAWSNLGTTLHHRGRYEDAMLALRRAIALAPQHANAHSGLGILLLMRGDLGEGWDEYEWRLRSSENKGPRFPEKPWRGESLAGKHIYVRAEQGFGDTLQFARYLAPLAARAASVTLRVHQQLVSLLRESFSGVTILGDRGDPALYQCDAVLLSLPRLFRTRLETIPAQVPYLRAPGAVVQRWRARLARMSGLTVGLYWAGNPEHVNDHRRSVDVRLLAPLLGVPGTSFASLQFGPRAADVEKLAGTRAPKSARGANEGAAIEDLSAEIAGFLEPAGAIAALDLVITVDSSAAHLAGALGGPVWLLLPWVSDWRWMREREDNPWYPNMRLFRQREGEDWSHVIARVADELAAVARGDRARLMPFKAGGDRRAAQAAAIMAAEAAQAAAAQPQPADIAPGQALTLAELRRREGLLGDADDLARQAAAAAPDVALELGPDNPETLDNLALAVKDLDRLEEAAELMRAALAIEQRSDKLHLHYGTILLDRHEIDAAAAAAARALALKPANPDAVNLMGRIAAERGDLAGALQRYRQALELKPDLADAYNNIGNALKDLGRLPEARDAYRTALAINPSMPGLYLNLADSKTFQPGDTDLDAMERLAAKTDGLSRSERMQLDFALGKAYADLRKHSRSFAHLLAGNAAKRATIAYDAQSTLALFDRIEALFTPALIAAKSGGGDPSRAPIFIIGMPRSGTTLVEQIIASHPAVYGGGELQTLNDVLLTVRGPDGARLAYPEFVAALDEAALAQIGTRYVASASALAAAEGRVGPGASLRITDKMPSNYYFAGLIHLALPHAKIIHTVRDPIDTCVSCFSKLFSAEQNHTYDLAELGRYYKRYAQLMRHWRRVLPKGSLLDVRYEDVVADLEGQARRIIAYCGLPWEARCLAFHATERPIRTASATQVRQPIYKSAIGRWRAYEEHLGPLLGALEGVSAAE